MTRHRPAVGRNTKQVIYTFISFPQEPGQFPVFVHCFDSYGKGDVTGVWNKTPTRRPLRWTGSNSTVDAQQCHLKHTLITVFGIWAEQCSLLGTSASLLVTSALPVTRTLVETISVPVTYRTLKKTW